MNLQRFLFICCFLVMSLPSVAQKNNLFDDSTKMTIYHGIRYKKSFDPIEFRVYLTDRAIEMDSLTSENCELILSMIDEPGKIDSIKIERKYAAFKCTTVLQHSAYNVIYVNTTITKKNTNVLYSYVFKPYIKKTKSVFVDNEIRSIELFNRSNEKEAAQIYFSDNQLDSAFYLMKGKKVEFEYIRTNDAEQAFYHGDTTRVLTYENSADRDLLLYDLSYSWLYPKLKEFGILISDTSILHVFELREESDKLKDLEE